VPLTNWQPSTIARPPTCLPRQAGSDKTHAEDPVLTLDTTDWSILEALQEGIPLVERPYRELAERIGLTEEEFLLRLERLISEGAIRRMGFRLRHHRAGVRGNMMVCWRVPEERVDEVGRLLAASDAVTHCYERPTLEGFPYNVYSMVHAATPEEALRTVEELSERVCLREYLVLRSLREWKKSTPVYRRPEE
jgi:siroheme decarboxylase